MFGQQGAKGDTFYIVKRGSAACWITDDKGTRKQAAEEAGCSTICGRNRCFGQGAAFVHTSENVDYFASDC